MSSKSEEQTASSRWVDAETLSNGAFEQLLTVIIGVAELGAQVKALSNEVITTSSRFIKMETLNIVNRNSLDN